MAYSASRDVNNTKKKTKKIYCANCAHCKLVRSQQGDGNHYTLRVRCEAGKWTKKLGGEKFYKYFTVARRSIEECDMYEPMGDEKDFIRELKKTLPIKDEVYSSTENQCSE
jgi:hypothetical protein